MEDKQRKLATCMTHYLGYGIFIAVILLGLTSCGSGGLGEPSYRVVDFDLGRDIETEQFLECAMPVSIEKQRYFSGVHAELNGRVNPNQEKKSHTRYELPSYYTMDLNSFKTVDGRRNASHLYLKLVYQVRHKQLVTKTYEKSRKRLSKTGYDLKRFDVKAFSYWRKVGPANASGQRDYFSYFVEDLKETPGVVHSGKGRLNASSEILFDLSPYFEAGLNSNDGLTFRFMMAYDDKQIRVHVRKEVFEYYGT